MRPIVTLTRRVLLAAGLGLTALPALAQDAPKKLSFEVRFTPEVRATPFTGRILVYSGRAAGRGEPRFGPDWFNPQPFYAVDVKDLKPGEPVVVDERAVAFPAPLRERPAMPTVYQAVLDQQQDYADIGSAPGNGMSAPVKVEPGGPERVMLVIDRLVPERRFPESESVKLLEMKSERLSRFHGRPVTLRAGIALPEGYEAAGTRQYPVVYFVTGFGGDHFTAVGISRFWPELTSKAGLNAIVAVIDATAYTGHHVWADSANNGPMGEALVKELIPEVERRYRAIPKPEARLLTGHSSGGWSTLWLQVTYPDTFGGTWSTSPDPVDFRDFQRIDLYAPNANMFTDAQGNPRPLARSGETPTLFYKRFSDMETVLGHGGQLQSFEAVFSPRGADGKPVLLYDRKTGTVDPEVAKAWRKYDINLVLSENWPKLKDRLKGKLHVYTGSLDTFYLEGAVRNLKETLTRLGSDASVEIVPGKNHGSLLDREMRARIVREMQASLRAASIPNGGA